MCNVGLDPRRAEGQKAAQGRGQRGPTPSEGGTADESLEKDTAMDRQIDAGRRPAP